MDKNTIQQDIHDILTEEIPDNMNILPDIHEHLKKQSTSQVRPMLTLSRVASVIAIFILVSAGGYALFQRNLVSKDIPQQRITDINETQTIEDVAVTLNWAYADAHRLALAYSMEYPQMDNFINSPVVTLKTADGLELMPAFGGGGGGGGAPNQPAFSESIMNFDTSIIEGTPDRLDLVLTLDFSADAVQSNQFTPMSGGGGGGGMSPVSGTDNTTMPPVGGGGGSGSSSGGGGGGGGSAPPQFATPDVRNILDRIYTFEFTLPFYGALQVEPNVETVESNDVTMTINTIRYTPSLTKFDMCYNMPNDEQWGAQIQIITDSEDSPFYSRQLMPIDATEDGRPCFEVRVTAAIPDDADEFMIDVLFLSQPIRPITSEAARAEEAYFAELDYIIEIDEDPYGYSMELLDYPDDVDEFDAEGFIQTNLFFKRYEGDWTFTVTLD